MTNAKVRTFNFDFYHFTNTVVRLSHLVENKKKRLIKGEIFIFSFL